MKGEPGRGRGDNLFDLALRKAGIGLQIQGDGAACFAARQPHETRHRAALRAPLAEAVQFGAWVESLVGQGDHPPLMADMNATSAPAASTQSPRTRVRFTAACTPGASSAAARSGSPSTINALSAARVAGAGSKGRSRQPATSLNRPKSRTVAMY